MTRVSAGYMSTISEYNQSVEIVTSTMPQAGPSTISSGSLFDLKALTAEHKDRFEKEGRSAVKGQARNKAVSKVSDRVSLRIKGVS